ncbi:TonB-dependent hemoglobin/transferrin/lactoferrin family receptor [Pseudoxanthomonas sp. SE1]|uniref:TonB-dependent hemoglobin/transferrin/lactoferrin family receptor n=1 Tax=Pseudoxanthomonas sp. SE1 TaxID=1664560 RepID=UPI00240D63CC|nr:TonB-dependent hemoglobin/transferrin/lactoferrin family receptor [Pseudoxanthomonas sp. SE1]WFC42684.1 TonB-dependent hemoglobin/transferrin/lactoferrin family receptor [Pseudoxanthomonas sp. SE1]
MMRPTLLTAAVWLAFAGPAYAAPDATAASSASADTGTHELERIQVTATRSERAVADVPNTVSVIDREEMDDHLVRDIKDLVRYEPGVTVTSNFGRFGLGGFRIRGLEGNRVRIQTDGIAVSDAFSIGSFSNANRDFVDLDTLKQVEIVRGPSSSLYGSDALGGVVSFITKDPSDYLDDGKDAYFGFRLGHDSSWNGLFGNATAAFGGERWSGLVNIGHRQGQETENQADVGGTGATRTLPNPQERDGRSLLAKLVFAPGEGQRFRLTVEGNEDSVDTDLLNQQGYQSLTRATNDRVIARDHQTRARVAFAHEWDGLSTGFADSLDWQVYRQDSETTQYTREERTLAAPTLRDIREREFNFDQRTYGLQANFRKAFGDAVRHDLVYGVDVARSETRQKRDGLRTFPLTGASTPVMLPDVFPVRDFPVSRTTTAALYVQDEIGFAEGAFRLVPGLRVDHYRLEPRHDAIFDADNPGVALADIRETSVSPKLGMVWKFAPAWSLFGGYAHGFRSPPYNDVNIGFTNVQFGYTAIANPDLKPETSDGLELGVRYSGDAMYAELSGYYNEYEDFIASMRNIGFDPTLGPAGLSVYQSQNIAEARIHGIEMKAGMDFGALSERWRGWSLRGAMAWSRGKGRGPESVDPGNGNTVEQVVTRDLDSVDPLTATVGLAYDARAWGIELAGRFVDRKQRVSDASYYRQPGYGVLDLYAHWDFAPGAKFNVGVFNLADRSYIEAGDIALVAAGSSTLDRYTASGRSLSASVAVSW